MVFVKGHLEIGYLQPGCGRRCATARAFGNANQKGTRKGSFDQLNALSALLFYSGFSGLEADFRVLAVAERLIDGGAAPAQRDGLLSADVIFVAISIGQRELTQVSCHQIRSVFLWGDVNCHGSPLSRSSKIEFMNVNAGAPSRNFSGVKVSARALDQSPAKAV
jgi:hypothetical protein